MTGMGFGGATGMGLMGGMPGAGMRGNQGVQGGCVLIVSNLDESRVNPDVLFTLFGVYGDVLRVKVLFAKKDTALIQVLYIIFAIYPQQQIPLCHGKCHADIKKRAVLEQQSWSLEIYVFCV